DRPDEPQEFTAHCRDHLLLTFAAAEQLAVAGVQSELGFPADGFDLLTHRSLAFPEGAADGRPVPIRPGSLDRDAPQMRVPGLRNPTPSRPGATGVLASTHPAVPHQLRGSLEAGELADFGDDRHRRDERDPTQRL